MKPTRLLLIALLALAAPFAAGQPTSSASPPPTATKPAAKDQAKPYPLKACLVTDNDLDSMGAEAAIVYQGQTIKFCCRPCEKKFLRAPEKYLAKLTPREAAKK